MTRILCTADLQLGAGTGYLPRPFGPGSRLHDHEQAWLDCCRLAIEHQCAAVIVAGDVFDDKHPGPTRLLAFKRGLDLLAAHRIQTIAIVGNHDVRAADEPTALELFQDAEHDLVMVHRQPGWDYLAGGQVAYAVLPWTTMGGLAALRGGGDRDLLHAEAGELLVQVARGLREQIPANVTHRILIGHWAVSGAAMPTGLPTDDLREVVIPLHALEEQGWDAIVLGHIHRPQALTEAAAGLRFYCGSPLPVTHGEAGYQHGAYLLELGPLLNELTFLPIESRPFVTLGVHEAADRYDSVPDGAIVRVTGRLTEAEHDTIDRATLERTLVAQGIGSVRVEIDVERETRARADHVTDELGPAQALDAWIQAAQPDADPGELRARHARYLTEATA